MTMLIAFSAICVAIIAVGYVVAGLKFRTAGICGWTALLILLVLIMAVTTDSGRSFGVMAPLIISFLCFSLATLINLRAHSQS